MHFLFLLKWKVKIGTQLRNRWDDCVLENILADKRGFA